MVTAATAASLLIEGSGSTSIPIYLYDRADGSLVLLSDKSSGNSGILILYKRCNDSRDDAWCTIFLRTLSRTLHTN
jgi:hypothetical protein